MRLALSALCLGVSLAGCKTNGGAHVADDTVATSPEGLQCPAGTHGVTTKVRVVAANISSGNNQSYDPGEGKRILTGLKPDVIMLQEFNYKDRSPAAYQSFVDEVLGLGGDAQADKHGFYFVEKQATDKIPNGVISRFPILDSGEWEDDKIPDRDFVWAKIDVPGEKKLWGVSVHLKASSDGASRAKRAAQAKRLVELTTTNIPANDYAVIGGDFNTNTRKEQCLDAFMGRGGNGEEVAGRRLYSDLHVPVDYRLASGARGADLPPREELVKETKTMNAGTNATRKANYDWVLPDVDLDKLHVPVEFGDEPSKIDGIDRFPEGLVFDSRTFINLDLVPPVKTTDSAATAMQHMAVVQDYAIPSCAADAAETGKPEEPAIQPVQPTQPVQPVEPDLPGLPVEESGAR